MQHDDLDWDDLRIFLQLARAGRLTQAGRALGLDDSTVGRRIVRLEKALGAALVERAGRRTSVTEQGEKLAQAAEAIESIVLSRVAGLGEEAVPLAGRVRVGAPEGLGIGYLAAALARLTAAHEQLETELVALPRTYSLASREVDIAITLDRPTTGQVTVRRLTDYTLDLYGTAAYFAGHGRPQHIADLTGHLFAGYIPDLLFTGELDFTRLAEGVDVKPRIRSTSVMAQLNAVAAGAALGILPTFLAAGHPGLERLFAGELRLTRTYWLSVHEDVRHRRRVQAVLQALTQQVRTDRTLFARR
ncbi:LysR family transcriptional regulator [Pseudoxanthobacter sp.]|uniref:LysR family transcriptional regulator n=1 Tax=Pseudoxanthobacter sp. TaxID=1925742 RepID=UPI002FE173BC